IAELRVRQSLKGTLMVGSVLVWHVATYEAPPGGSGDSLVYPGDRARLYLRRSTAGVFDSWNDAGNEWIVRQDFSTNNLPSKVGESIPIIGTRTVGPEHAVRRASEEQSRRRYCAPKKTLPDSRLPCLYSTVHHICFTNLFSWSSTNMICCVKQMNTGDWGDLDESKSRPGFGHWRQWMFR
ncbi:MAG: hypothetical protein KDB27_15255, partial [Planctomycetales bacterium]|nr:hypothetical protein [Planctomycetales bacterium]